MLTKPQFFYDHTTKQALGFQNPFYLKKAQQLEPKLYVGDIIEKTNPIVIFDSKETLILAEESRSKMHLKQQDPMMLEKKVNTTPIDYVVLNQLSQDFKTRFVPQTELSAEQDFWSKNSVNSPEPTLSSRPTKVEVPKELPKVSMVNTSLKKLKYHLAGFDVVVKERTTPTAITEGSWGFEHTKACFRDEIIPFVKALKDLFNTFNQYLVDELSEVQNVFHQMEQAMEQHRLESKTFEVKMNQVLNENERLLKQVLSKDIVNIIVNSSVNVHECEKCLQLETELQTDFIEKEIYDKLFKSFTTLEKHCISLEVDSQLNQEIFQRDNPVSNQILSGIKNEDKIKHELEEIETINIELDHRVTKLIAENEHLKQTYKQLYDSIKPARNEHLKQTYKQLYDSIKPARIRSKEHCDDLINQVNLKSVEISDLNASLQEKVLVITTLEDDLRKLKGKVIVDNDITKHPSDPEMLKIDVEPKTPKLLNKQIAHSAYIKHTQEETTVLRDLVEHVKSKYPLDQSLESACRYAKLVQELLTNISNTCPSINNADGKLVVVTPKNKDKSVRFTKLVTSSGNTITKTKSTSNPVSNKPVLSSTGVKPSTSTSRSQPSDNTKKDKIRQTPSSTQKNKVEAHPRKVKSSLKNKDCVVESKATAHVQHSRLNANSKLKCVKCNGCMISANHDLCVLDFINNVHARNKSKFVKKNSKKKVWKPTGKIELDVIQNACSEKEDSNSETASSKLVKECSLNSKTKDVHAIKYKMSKAKERCMTYFRSLHSHLQVLSNTDLKGTHIEHGFRREFMSIFDDGIRDSLLGGKQPDSSKFTLDYNSQMTDTYFVEYTGLKVQHFKDTLLQNLESIRTDSTVQDDSSRSGNDTDADDADIRPIYDEEPMAKIQERDRNSTTSVPTSARIQTTTDDRKPKPRSNNQTSRSLPVSKSSRVMITAVPKADHFKSSSSFSDSKNFVFYMTIAKPTEKHLTAVKQIFRYLKNTINMGLWYPKDTSFELTSFSDSDHVGCLDSRKSTSGGIEFLGGDKLVSWSFKKQDCTSMSLAEFEYVSLSACCAQIQTSVLQSCTSEVGFITTYSYSSFQSQSFSIKIVDTKLPQRSSKSNQEPYFGEIVSLMIIFGITKKKKDTKLDDDTTRQANTTGDGYQFAVELEMPLVEPLDLARVVNKPIVLKPTSTEDLPLAQLLISNDNSHLLLTKAPTACDQIVGVSSNVRRRLTMSQSIMPVNASRLPRTSKQHLRPTDILRNHDTPSDYATQACMHFH
ncbi:hypothetical protein Tco_0139646 [Tanacetum coccineum]